MLVARAQGQPISGPMASFQANKPTDTASYVSAFGPEAAPFSPEALRMHTLGEVGKGLGMAGRGMSDTSALAPLYKDVLGQIGGGAGAQQPPPPPGSPLGRISELPPELQEEGKAAILAGDIAAENKLREAAGLQPVPEEPWSLKKKIGYGAGAAAGLPVAAWAARGIPSYFKWGFGLGGKAAPAAKGVVQKTLPGMETAATQGASKASRLFGWLKGAGKGAAKVAGPIGIALALNDMASAAGHGSEFNPDTATPEMMEQFRNSIRAGRERAQRTNEEMRRLGLPIPGQRKKRPPGAFQFYRNGRALPY